MRMATHVIQFEDDGPGAGRRKSSRLRLGLPGKVVMITGHEPCRLEDLSQTGACVTMTGMSPPIGDEVVLVAQGVEAFGDVVWRRGKRFGVLFERPLSRDELIRLRAVHDHFRMLEEQQALNRAREFVQGRRV